MNNKISVIRFIAALIGFVTAHNTFSTTAHEEAIRQLVKKYHRPITILDLRPHEHSYLFRLARQYNNVVGIMLDRDFSQKLFDHCNNNRLHNIVLMQFDYSIKEIARLGECEHFDIVIARNVLPLFDQKWEQAINSLLLLGDYIFIDAPAHQSELQEYMISNGGEQVATAADSNLYLFSKNKNEIRRRRWDYFLSQPGEYTIKSTFTEKKLHKNKKSEKKKPATSNWHAGINLYTFCKLDGVYPTKHIIRELVKPMKNLKHNDMKVFNLIVQGTKLQPIDGAEEGRHWDTAEGVQHILNHFKRISIDTPEVTTEPLLEDEVTFVFNDEDIIYDLSFFGFDE
ncbi:MAG TPA: hypothetical protein VFF04_05840 [Candidatus Babeliales bacterium]|nr:hypothetical protein [Candidatus Babeliales bacterium]